MKINFNNSNNGKRKDKEETEFMKGNYGTMMKMREKKVPEIQDTIQEALKDYNGESICIIIQREDENGMPEHSQMVMAGVSRMECQVAMGKALDKASHKAIEMLLENSKGDIKTMLAVAAAMATMLGQELED